LAAYFAELCLIREPNHIEVLKYLTVFYQNSYQYTKGITTAKPCYELAENLVDKILTNHLVIRAFMSATGF
jgi:predicted O-linked N-acetylglucosamine transferase (SPINDLY family)